MWFQKLSDLVGRLGGGYTRAIELRLGQSDLQVKQALKW